MIPAATDCDLGRLAKSVELAVEAEARTKYPPSFTNVPEGVVARGGVTSPAAAGAAFTAGAEEKKLDHEFLML